MENGTRLYINLTNKCNTDCPFCCMYSGTNKNTFMSFEIFKEIIDSNCDDIFDVQLEGGEPLLHRELYLFLEYALSKNNLRKIYLLTNGILLDKHIKRLVDLSNYYQKDIEIKISVNYWLLEKNTDHIEKVSMYYFATKYLEHFNIRINGRVRDKKEFDELDKLLTKYRMRDIAFIGMLQSYGKLLESKEYDKPKIVQIIENWKLFASDGKCFNNDLLARSEHEKELL